MSDNERRFTLLVPVDYSPSSGRAVDWALDYAQHTPCEIHLLHVLDRGVHLSDLSSNMYEIETELNLFTVAALNGSTVAARNELNTVAREFLSNLRHQPIERHVAIGDAATEILRLARCLDSDLIVMGTRGRTGLRRAVLGSVAESVVRHATCPVVCVKPELQAGSRQRRSLRSVHQDSASSLH